ncbi:aminotransferase class I/II-fold pyridoxal phosphate-dependent enzyme [Dyadobacter luticola]|uniref:Pyridoxal phosphate-dependent aminotransferase family protein n=1 Tax=Dyadobacter luticola TaxID=1979387 RepID=A0A5R9KV31_9BACT|nr:aminotransferase class I/II-fold pyridoxal phosphate-dependent enzyme [Dyadobacter luticola]TLV00028.1 pyridoxal phosphate-dependent aminotransferase family protein [Dyadobacter luticola]
MSFFTANHLPGRIVKTQQGAEYLWFSGTDYLGMAHNEAFRNYLIKATKAYGMHFGSSRNGSLRLGIYESAETTFANFIGAESALLVSSGMWAGQLVLKEIEEIVKSDAGEYVVHYHYAPKVHPALWGNHFKSNVDSWKDWALDTTSKINADNSSDIHIICSDAIGSPLVEAFDFSIFGQIQILKNVWLIIDESHSVGVLGKNGIGVRAQIPARLIENTIFVSSLNKGIGIPAGAIWGSKKIIDMLRQSPWFAGASPPTPAYIAAFQQILENNIYQTENQKLLGQIRYFSGMLAGNIEFLSTPDYPVFCSTNPDLYQFLLANGIMASCFSYPSPTDPPITRIAISTLHKKEDLSRLAEVYNRFF